MPKKTETEVFVVTDHIGYPCVVRTSEETFDRDRAVLVGVAGQGSVFLMSGEPERSPYALYENLDAYLLDRHGLKFKEDVSANGDS